MGSNLARILAVVILLLALGALTLALVRGGDILMIVLGLVLLATSMELFRQGRGVEEDE
jgi:hypothetical protein